jgi:4a-hydroxytetrahydrobiopterin dehydratase
MEKGWENTGHALVREFVFSDFAGAMAFVNRVARVAEERDHHPDIQIRWNKVVLTLSTHTSGGLTEKDFRLAEEVDSL